MSKLTNWFVNTFGSDKVMHFLGGAWITSALTPFGWYGIVVSFVLVFALSFVKEQFLDETFDKNDINAALMGSALSAILFGIITFIRHLF